MISLEEALAKILSHTKPAAIVERPLADALGCFIGKGLLATIPLPGFDNSMMDGYAVTAERTRSDLPIPVIGEQPAGPDLGLSMESGEAIRIFTGAPMPPGADAVIMQEDVTATPNGIVCKEPVEPGENVRRQGSDLCIGQRLLTAGDRLTPGRIGLLASQGFSQVDVHSQPRTAVLSTGDELQQIGEPLRPGQIYNSNGLMLQAQLQRLGVPGATIHHCADTLEDTIRTIDELAAVNDVIILSGGVSVGDHDYIKPALIALGMAPDLWRVRMKPGKPFLYAHRDSPRPVHVFGLPGNPVSAYVTFTLLVRPALLKLMGANEAALKPKSIPVRLNEALDARGDRPHFFRGEISEDGTFSTRGLQRSDALFALSRANALVRVDPDHPLAAGDLAPAILLDT